MSIQDLRFMLESVISFSVTIMVVLGILLVVIKLKK